MPTSAAIQAIYSTPSMSRPGAKKVTNPFDSDSDDEYTSKTREVSPSSCSLEHKSMQKLENYAVQKSTETTEKANDCLKIAENIRVDATRTLVTLHDQGGLINATHQMAVQMDKDLTKGESLLGNLGGWFSKPWKPKAGKKIKGPVLIEENSSVKNEKRKEKRNKLGLSQGEAKERQYAEPTSAMEKVQVEKKKQDETLSDLSNVLGQLKGIASDMGTEIDRQNKALDFLSEDIEELNFRVKGANQRVRHLVGK